MSILPDPIPEAAGYGRISIPARLRHDVICPNGERASCDYCSGPASEADHVVPVARGGLTVRENLAPVCAPCNREKSDRTVAEWHDWRIARGYCWPPRDRWEATGELFRAVEAEHGLSACAAWYDVLRGRVKPTPYDKWFGAWIGRVHRGQFSPTADEVALLVAVLPAGGAA